ncbi:MAG: urate hydroxylase PuuD [Betaproteobacteria bacterium]|nr:urate hydroxylase PuuD [Betaproteobacteria bacterium]
MDFVQLGLGRWLHVLAGVMWIGLLYYFNFVNVAAAAEAAKDGTAAGITKHVVPRALLYFRWAAVVTWLAGAMILGVHFLDAFFFLKPAYYPIGMGAWLGTIMVFNVWVLIWPNQKKVLGIVQATDEEKGRARRVAFLASRTNTMLSLPMLFFMTASGGMFRTAVFG